jgi:hypothetical protein
MNGDDGGRGDAEGQVVTDGFYGWVIAPIEPPDEVAYSLEQSLDLLAALEDARDVLVGSDHLALVVQLEHQVAVLSRKLGFDQPGGGDGR